MYPSSPTIRWVTQISEIDREAWDALALPLKTPFLEWDWLWLMEHPAAPPPGPAGFPGT